MSSLLQPFAVGPLVGESGPDHCRIFAALPVDTLGIGEKRFYGWIRYRLAPGDDAAAPWSAPLRFRLNSNFDDTGVVVLRDLRPGSAYQFQSGWSQDAEPTELDWQQLAMGRFVTDDPQQTTTRFLFGSCCYRRVGLDGELDDDRADKIFKEMAGWSADQPADFILYAGDQIYADSTYRVGAASSERDYYHIYRRSFSQPNMAALLRSHNHYMILDDHEIEDNWPSRAAAELWTSKYPAALKAYQIYQASHSPAVPLDEEGRYLDRDPDHLWYCFSRGPADFFVMDLRTERVLSRWYWQRQMVSDSQLAALSQWLESEPDRIKVLVSSVLLFPEQRPPFVGQDSWQGFQHQRDKLLNILAHSSSERLVVLSGDVHASFYARLELRGGKVLHNWTCSGLFWPASLFAFRHYRAMFRSGVPLRSRLGHSKGQVTIPGEVYSRDGFSQVQFDQQGATFTFIDRRGVAQPAVSRTISW